MTSHTHCCLPVFQLLSRLPVSNKEYGNFAWDGDIPAYEPTTLKSKKAWRTREMQLEVERDDRGELNSPVMSDPNNIGHQQYRCVRARASRATCQTISERKLMNAVSKFSSDVI